MGTLLHERHAVRDSYNTDYYFILQQIRDKTSEENTLPPLSSNAHYVEHENKCSDLGAVG